MSFIDYLKENNFASPLSPNGQNFGMTTVDAPVNAIGISPHKHQLKVDKQGNGISAEGAEDSHVHLIINGLIGYASGHQHSIEAGSLRPDDRAFRTGDTNGQVM